MFELAFAVLLVPRMVGAAISNIHDCDEVFNYWEPMHFLLFGSGMQTWEYSPTFALRSYFYLLPHATPTALLWLIGVYDKVTAFYFTRAVLGALSAAVEARLCAAVARSTSFGPRIAWLLLGFLAVAPGMLHASVAFLPSSTAMLLCTLAVALWLDRQHRGAIVCIGASTILVWPFSGALGVPLAIDVVLRQCKVELFAVTAGVALVALLVPSVLVDTFFYGRPAIAGLNIVLYNVLSESTSSELYGTEPFSFYFFNGFLNLSMAFVLGLAGPLVALVAPVRGGAVSTALYLSPLLVWVAIFFPQAHKEERFLFPVYPLMCLSGAAALVWVTELLCTAAGRLSAALRRPAVSARVVIPGAAFAVFCALSLSRIVASHRNYHGVLDVYSHLARVQVPEGGATLCLGKEWHRFPSAFFLAEASVGADGRSSGGVTVEFIKSAYDGHLPAHFDATAGTSADGAPFNNMNREEASRYVPISSCDFIVDRDDGDSPHELEPAFTRSDRWERVRCARFLDAARTPSLARAFFLPGVSEHTVFTEYCLLRRKSARSWLLY